MSLGLSQITVVEACEKHWEGYKGNCNFFVEAVAAELRIFLPGAGASADWMSFMISEWLPISDQMFTIPSGSASGLWAAQWAMKGHFVVAGLSAAEINTARDLKKEKLTSHGHVVVVVPGWSRTGWPTGYWGSHGSVGMKNESLSKTFRSPLKDKILISLPYGKLVNQKPGI